MRVSLLNAITVDLIDKLDFVPAMDFQDTYFPSEKIRILEKMDLSEYYLLELIHLDCLSSEAIKNHFAEKINWLENSNLTDFVDKPSLIEVFFMQNHSPSKINAIKSFLNSSVDRGLSTAFIIVDFENDDLIIDWGMLDPCLDIEYIIEYWLDHDASEYEKLPDLENIINHEDPVPVLHEASKTSPATYALTLINIAVWLTGEVLFFLYHENLINFWGIKNNSLILAGQYWRLFTPMFLHIDMVHLTANCFSLLIFGYRVERVFGTVKYLLIYFTAGFTGSLISFTFSQYDSLGASGAIMGVGGALVYLWVKNRYFFSLYRKKYLSLVFIVFFNLLFGFLNPGIDNYAHIGGFLCGLLICYLLNYINRSE